MRLLADVSALTKTPDGSRGWLCGWGGTRKLVMKDPLTAKSFASGGRARTWLVNAAPGMTYRKYAHAVSDTGRMTVAIVVEGEPSDSTWTNLAAEDCAAARRQWAEHYARLSSFDWTCDQTEDAAFDAALAADADHVAAVVRRDGFSRLEVDGRDVPPVPYRAKGASAAADGKPSRVTYAGKPLQDAGVRLGVIGVRLTDYPGNPGPWSERGFDVEAVVRRIRSEMRAGDASLFILGLNVSAYPSFAEAHPDEVWLRPDGSPVEGNAGSAFPDKYNDGAAANVGNLRWRWMSYASPAWRTAVKDAVAKLVAALKRSGLSKRIVGVHFCGAHDGQFAVPFEDHSSCARAGYARYLAARGLQPDSPEGGYAFYCKQLGFWAVEDFSRFAKAAFGKPVVAVRWCMRPFFGAADSSYDIGSFLRSDAVDVIVVQPTYNQRPPALSQGVRLPCESLHRHGKLMLFEFDLRTAAALEGWAKSVIDVQGLGQSDDLPMWRTTFRKHAGMMMAKRMGWWFYDMAAGWYRGEDICADIGDVMRTYGACRGVAADPWHPDLALVVDEGALLARRSDGILGLQWPRTAASGVPHDFLMADDLRDDPTLVRRYKALVLCGFNAPDGRQRRWMDGIAAQGVRTLVAPESGYAPEELNRFVRSAGGYVALPPGVAQVDMNGDFVSIHALVPGEADFRMPFAAELVNLKSGVAEAVVDGRVRLSLTAGETCWFRLKR